MTEDQLSDLLPPKDPTPVNAVRFSKYLLPLLIALIVLTFVNLIVSISILNSQGTPELPDSLDSETAKEHLADFFKKAYNEGDNNKLIEWFDQAARLKFERAQFDRQMIDLHSMFPSLENLLFASYECQDQPNGVKVCRLYYNGKTNTGKVVLLTIFVQSQGSEKHRVVGFTLTSL
jgi:hypothetical protein